MNKKLIAWIAGSVLSGGVALTVIGMAVAHWISLEIAEQLAAEGIVPVSDVTAIDTRVGNLEGLHGTDIERVESKAERIAQILMEN